MKCRKLAIPYVVWMALFIVIPLVLVVVYAFTSKAGGFTLDNFKNMVQYSGSFIRSFYLSFIATIICLVIGYPVAYFLAKERPGVRRFVMVLVMLPMWINFLLRTYAWMSLLENTGLINRFLSAIGVFDLINPVFGTNLEFFPMINTPGAIILGLVYNYIPFMILPIMSVIEKLDHRVIEAAQDLGANSMQVFSRIVLPLSMPGVLSGVTMVFIPAVSTFAISQLLGGGMTLMLGDLIEMQFYGNAYNPYLGSAISLVMMVIVLVFMYFMNRFGDGESEAMVL